MLQAKNLKGDFGTKTRLIYKQLLTTSLCNCFHNFQDWNLSSQTAPSTKKFLVASSKPNTLHQNALKLFFF